MTAKKEDRRGLPRTGRVRVALLVLVAAGIVAVPAAWALNDFTDVSSINPFHDAISAVKTAAITSGKTCVPPGTPPTFCPSEAITREAMAAFVQRGLPRIEQDTSTDGTDIPESLATVDQLTGNITIGGTGGSQFVTVDGWATIDSLGTVTGPCEFRGWIVGDEGTADEVSGDFQYLEVEASDGDIDATLRSTFSFVATSGEHSYTLKTALWNASCSTTHASNTFQVDETGLRIVSTPFNQYADGSSYLGTGAAITSVSTAPEGE